MKKLLALLFAAALLAASIPSPAESADYTAMDFTTLAAIKQAVDLEYYSRKEAKPIKMPAGMYVAGVDIKPGRYNVITNEPSEYSVRIHVYESREKYDERPSGYYGEYLSDDYVSLGDTPISIRLAEGNFVLIQNGNTLFSASEFSDEDSYQYEVPEGTVVPVGSYTVGESGDIPPATFTVYAAEVGGGDLRVYYNEETFKADGSWHLGYDKHIEVAPLKSEPVVLEEGYVVYVEKPVVMKKQAKLAFD